MVDISNAINKPEEVVAKLVELDIAQFNAHAGMAAQEKDSDGLFDGPAFPHGTARANPLRASPNIG